MSRCAISLVGLLCVCLVGVVRAGSTTRPVEAGFMLRSSAVAEGGALPREFTGDGVGVSPPVSWVGEPAGTKWFALVMHHLDPEGKVKWYWVVYDIPGEVHELAKGEAGVGILGNNSVNRKVGYAPPHSKGPGVKRYVLTLYALSGTPRVRELPAEVSWEVLKKGMEGLVLGVAELNVTYDRTDVIGR